MNDMNKSTPLPPAHDSQQHYGLPAGYFDQLEERLLAQLPQEEPAEALPSKPTLWVRLRPLLYLAAMFVSMNLIFRAFYPSDQPQEVQTAEAGSPATEEVYDDYLADYAERMQAGQAYSVYYQDLSGEPLATYTSYE